MSIPREFIDLLLTKIDIVDTINIHVPLRKKSGSNYFARCPFHNEKSASFSVSAPKQFYYCFGCGAHGNAIDFMMEHDRLSFPEAIETLARQAGMEVPRTEDAARKEESITPLYELMQTIARCYYEQLSKTERAINYLKGRQISGKIAKQFMLGYAPSCWSHILDTYGKTDSERKKLLDTGLIIRKEVGSFYDRFRDRIIFPIHDYRGRLIGFGGRIIDQGEPKYLNSPETPLFQKGHELYGLHHAIKANRQLDRILIVEGYMDVIALFENDITYAVATLGTATTPHHLQRLLRYTADIIFCFDGDNAGRTAAWRALQTMLPMMQDNFQVRFLFLPEGEDPDSLVRKEGKIVFEKRIEQGLSLSAFFFQHLADEYEMSSMEGRARFAAAALNFINQIPDSLFQGMIVEELAKRARIDISELKKQVKTTENAAPQPPRKKPLEIKAILPKPIRRAIALIIQYPELANKLVEPLPASQLTGVEFFKELIEIARVRPNMTTGAYLELYRGQKEEAFVARMTTEEMMFPEAGVENEFLGAIKQISGLIMQEEIDRLLVKAAQESLTENEKQELVACITKKKHVTV